MMPRISRTLGLVVLLGSLGSSGVPTALAQPAASRTAQREQFLQLLLERQDRAIQQNLARRLAAIEARQARLETVPPRNPQQAQVLEWLAGRLSQFARNVRELIINPPASPLRQAIEQRLQALRVRADLIEFRLDRLSQLEPINDRRARQIERVMAAWKQQYQATMGQIEFLDRVVATPMAPREVVGAFRSPLSP